MTVHQLSVFIENKSGALVRVLRLLKQENIQLIASTIADTADFGIFRIICSEPEKACGVLKEAGDLGFGHLELGFAEELGELGIEFDEVIA